MGERGVRVLLAAALVVAACRKGTAPPPPGPDAQSGLPPEPPPATMPPWGTTEQLGAYIDEQVGAFGKAWGDAYAFRGVVAIAKDGVLVTTRGYGKANLHAGAVPDESTRFRVGSITKQMTAACVLQLAERGKLDVSDPVTKHLPDFPRATGDGITLRHLLSQTSGLPSYTDDAALMAARGTPHTPAEVRAVFQSAPLHFAPGTRWEYSNSNYYLLGLVIEKVSGVTYERYLQEQVLGPAGMTRTSTVDAPDAPNTAVGYDRDDDENLIVAHPVDASVPYAAGALRSTALDLARWDQALAGTTVLSEAAKAKMLTPVLDHYGYGVGVDELDGHRLVTHGGGIDGFNAVLMRIPDAGVAIVALANGPVDAQPIVRALRPYVLEGRRTPPKVERPVAPMTEAVVARARGEYALTATARRDVASRLPAKEVDAMARAAVRVSSNRLYFKPIGQPEERLFSGGGDLLFTKRDGLEIVLDAGAAARGFSMTQGDLALRYERR